MKLKKGNLWDSADDAILVTANSYIRKDGALVMGRGAALELKERNSLLPFIFGDQVTRYGEKYGVLLTHPYSVVDNEKVYGKYYGIFQVKYHFKDKARLDLIEYSTNSLIKLINSDLNLGNISMNFPGIGYGQLLREDVLPIIEQLPDSVTIYEKG